MARAHRTERQFQRLVRRTASVMLLAFVAVLTFTVIVLSLTHPAHWVLALGVLIPAALGTLWELVRMNSP